MALARFSFFLFNYYALRSLCTTPVANLQSSSVTRQIYLEYIINDKFGWNWREKRGAFLTEEKTVFHIFF